MEISAFKHRIVSMSMIAVLAMGWSLALGVLGLWLLFGDQSGTLAGTLAGSISWTKASSESVRINGGIVALIGSQIVFLLCIADRVYPRAHPMMTRTIEMALGAIFFVSACVLGGSALIAGSTLIG